MKTFLILISFSLLSTLALAQHNYQIQLDSINEAYFDTTTQTWDFNVTQKYNYNWLGSLSKCANATYGQSNNTNRKYFTYQAGNLVEEKQWVCTNCPSDTTMAYKGKTTYAYDSNDNLINLKKYVLDSTNSEFVQTEHLYTYDQNGKQLTEIILSRTHSYQSLDTISNNFNIYLNGQKVIYGTNHQNPTTLVWDTLSKYYCDYDALGNLEQVDYYQFNNSTQSFEKKAEITYTYNNLQQLTDYFRDNLGSNFDDKHSYEYDANGNNTHIHVWKRINASQWDTSSTFKFTYDTNYQIDEVAIDPNYPTYMSMVRPKPLVSYHPLLEIRQTVPSSQNLFKRVYHYSSFPLNIPSGGVAQANIYPNPAKEHLHIELDATDQQALLRIYDVSGKLIQSQKILNKEKINISGLESGLYIYHIQSEQKQYSGRFIVE